MPFTKRSIQATKHFCCHDNQLRSSVLVWWYGAPILPTIFPNAAALQPTDWTFHAIHVSNATECVAYDAMATRKPLAWHWFHNGNDRRRTPDSWRRVGGQWSIVISIHRSFPVKLWRRRGFGELASIPTVWKSTQPFSRCVPTLEHRLRRCTKLKPNAPCESFLVFVRIVCNQLTESVGLCPIVQIA